MRDEVREMILGALDVDYMSESCQDAIKTGNHYQSLDLGDSTTQGFRTARADFLDRVDFHDKKVLDLGSNLGEMSRGARARGARLVDGFEYDPYFVELADLVNVHNGVTRVSFYRRDITDPSIYGEQYDIVLLLSVFIYARRVVDRLAEITDVLVLETHKLHGNLQETYLDPITRYFPHYTILGETEWGTIHDPGETRAVLVFAKTEELLRSTLVEVPARNADAPTHAGTGRHETFSTDIDIRRTQPNEPFFERFPAPTGADVLAAVAEHELDLDALLEGPDAGRRYRSWTYWFLMLRGYLEYRERGTVDPGNAYLRGPLRTRLEEAGISVYVTPDYGLLGVETYEGKMAELLAWASVQGFDVVLANSLIGFIGVDLASRLGIPAIFMVHESMETPRWSVATHRWLTPHRYVRERMRLALGTASAVVFEAEATRRQYAHLGDPGRFRAMPYAVELDQIAERRESFDDGTLRRRLGIPEGTTVVLCLGTFEPRKAQTSIVQAFSLIAEQHPDAWLCLVGDLGDSFSNSVREYITRAALWPRVVIRPMVDDPYEWLAVADVLVLASDIESLPRVVLEAMALGTLVVSTSIFGLTDLIDDGRTGILCEPRDIAALAGALDRALSATPEERRRITDAASSMVRRNHQPEGYARDFTTLIEEVLDGATGPRPQPGRNVMAPARTREL